MSIRFHSIYTVGTAVSLALLAGGCAMDSEESAMQEGKVAEASTQVFDYAPEGAEPAAKEVVEDLTAKGTWSEQRPRGNSFEAAITLQPGESITCSTSNGSAGVDTVLALLRRHDNGTGSPHANNPYTARIGFQTLAVNDDFNGLYSQITYTNTSGREENTFLEGFAWASSIGSAQVTCTNTDYGIQNFTAGSVKTTCDQGAVHTSDSAGDPVLLMINIDAGLGDGVWNDDSPDGGTYESKITGATGKWMWFVAQGWNDGTTTINCAL